MWRHRFMRLGILAFAGQAACLGNTYGRSPSDSPQRFLVVLAANPIPKSSPSGVALSQAENSVIRLLFSPGTVMQGRPWYRFGTDTLTFIETGPGPRAFESEAAARGHWTTVDFGYGRLVTRPFIKVREVRFANLFHPNPRPHQLDVDLALAATSPSWLTTTVPIHLIVLRQKPLASPHLSPAVERHLEQESSRYTLADRHLVAFAGAFGTDFIVETAKIVPRSPASVGFASAGRAPFRLGPALKVLGRLFGDLLSIAAALALLRWAWFHRFRARHFELWIPGFAGAFCLPALQRFTLAEYHARIPRYAGEPAAHLELPSRLIRLLFYSRASLRWDPRLRVEGLPAGTTECRLLRLPRFVRFVWVERPQQAGSLGISLERRSMLGGNDRMSVTVNFLSLTRIERE